MTAAAAGAKLRAAAARVVHAVRIEGSSLDAALAKADAGTPLTERPLLHHLCYESLRFHWQIREHIAALLSKPLARRDAIVEDLLAVGLAQLEQSRIKPHAAVTLTVEATRLLKKPKLAGLVNAVLRRSQRESFTAESDEARFNHPAWMLDQLKQDWPEHWEQIAAANNERAPMWLRVNVKKTDAQSYCRLLAAEDDTGAATADLLPGADAAVRLAAPRPVERLPGFATGEVSVQDAAAQLAAPWLLAAGGMRILDACAAPGGKTAHLSELALPGATITAIDNDADRLALVQETLTRTGGCASVLHADASAPGDWWDGQPFDRILLDAPCSASGVIRRHPDIRLLRRASDLPALAARQHALLEALWPLLAPGGKLLYVTCSVFAAENDAIVGDFLAAQADADEECLLPNNNNRDLMTKKPVGGQVLPGIRGMDGFYYACLTKSP
ncbi:MAG: 16S rRNA (cytosine(967)-C(5))-methyltransferase RsmB [Woeseia sp.]|nr:16S rRNA (cytosine(967)-C(5))-methyltransferase RsmB [Woeseia sp.]